MRCISIAILDNFRSELDEVLLGEGLSILRIDTIKDPLIREVLGENVIEEAQKSNEWIGSAPKRLSYLPVQIRENVTVTRLAASSNYALKWENRAPANKVQLEDALWFRDTLMALRLLKAGRIGRYSTLRIIVAEEESSLVKRVEPDYDLFLHPLPLFPFGGVYMLNHSEMGTLTELLKAIRKVKRERVRIALTRFGRLSNYVDPSDVFDEMMVNQPDQIVDATIALEALYIDKREEKTKLFGRVPRHLCPNERAGRKKIGQLVRNLSALRNAIVHADLQKLSEHALFKEKQRVSPTALLTSVSMLLRSILREILLGGKEAQFFSKVFRRHLDQSM